METDGAIPASVIEQIEGLRPSLCFAGACVMRYRFSSSLELRELLDAEGLDPENYAIKREAFISGKTEDEIIAELDRRIAVTRASLERGRSESQRSLSGLTDGAAVKFASRERALVSDGLFSRTIGYALAVNEVNACGGKIVAFPTAGSSASFPERFGLGGDTREQVPPSRLSMIECAGRS